MSEQPEKLGSAAIDVKPFADAASLRAELAEIDRTLDWLAAVEPPCRHPECEAGWRAKLEERLDRLRAQRAATSARLEELHRD